MATVNSTVSHVRRMARVAGLVVLVAVVAVFIRGLASNQADLDNLASFQAKSGLAVGPEWAWFANGLHGDGAVFAIMTSDPLGRGEGALIFDPSYRYARVGYPLAAFLASIGQESLILLGLSLVGLGSVVLVSIVTIGLRPTLGPKAWLLILNPALAIGFLYDTPEPLGIALLVIALRGGRLAAAIGLAVVRESYLAALARRRLSFLMVLIVAIGVRLFWVFHFGDSPLGGAGNLALPFIGVASQPSATGVIVTVTALATVVIGIRRRNLAWILSGILVCSLGESVLADPINALRAGGMLPVLWAFGPNHRPGFVGFEPPSPSLRSDGPPAPQGDNTETTDRSGALSPLSEGGTDRTK
jgi:hypothetical protein